MTDVVCVVRFWSKADQNQQSFEQPGNRHIRLASVLLGRNSIDFYHRKYIWLFTKEFVPCSDTVVLLLTNKDVCRNAE